MRFVGPVTELAGALVRPHDLELHHEYPGGGAVRGTVDRVARVGFEVRVRLAVQDDPPVLATLTRAQATALGVSQGAELWIWPAPGAPTVTTRPLPHYGTSFRDAESAKVGVR
ncbi:MAG: TOBE domain-containing protein [Stackebrandtia sp.]